MHYLGQRLRFHDRTVMELTKDLEKKLECLSDKVTALEKQLSMSQKQLQENDFLSLPKIARPAISVVIAAYNCENFIQQCIDSLLNQTFKNYEIIVVDDGSSDSTLSILHDYERRYDFISVFHQSNGFAGAARNRGMYHAKGEYLLFLDADDFFEPLMLERAYSKALETGSEIVVFHAREYDNINHNFKPAYFPVSPQLFPSEPKNYTGFNGRLFQANSSIAWNKLIKRSLIDRVGVKFSTTKSANDTVFIYTLLTQANHISLVNEVLANYRVNNPNSLQRSKSSSWECLPQAFVELKNKLIDLNVYDEVKQSFVNKVLQSSIYYLSTIDAETKIKMSASLQNKYFDLLDIKNLENSKQYIFNANFLSKYKEIQSKTYIPIVYATDNNYAKYLSVSLESVLQNSTDSEKILFFVLIDSQFDEENKTKLQEQVMRYGAYIEFVEMDNAYQTQQMKIAHITHHTYYRLQIPDLFSCFNKLIYLDCDTVVNCNIRELFNQDIGNNHFVGVKAPAFTNAKHQKRLGIDTSNYINAGVLLINNEQLIRDRMISKFNDLLSKQYSCQDQDVINVASVGKIKTINFGFNFMTKYLTNYEKLIADGTFERKDFLANLMNPKIIHYADKIKPWQDIESPMSQLFWKYAVSSPYFITTVQNNLIS